MAVARVRLGSFLTRNNMGTQLLCLHFVYKVIKLSLALTTVSPNCFQAAANCEPSCVAQNKTPKMALSRVF